jgi:prepilin-type N-terminal cleavage/methylation domain-containing protein
MLLTRPRSTKATCRQTLRGRSAFCRWTLRGQSETSYKYKQLACQKLAGSPTGHRVSGDRFGFTLLEIMLVLTLIAMIGAVAVPRFADVFARQRLQASAEKIRLDLDRARLVAMQTGQAQMFECVIGDGKYSVHPLTQQKDMVNTGAGATVVTQYGAVAATTEDGMLAAAGTNALSGDVRTLEETVTFTSCIVSTDSRSYGLAQESQSNGGQLSVNTLGQAILFYPDGSTSNAEIRLQNKRGDARAVRLRGLTGHAKVMTLTGLAPGSADTQ